MTGTAIPVARPVAAPAEEVPIVPHAGEIPADRNFRLVLAVSGFLTLLVLASIGGFLLWKGWATIHKVGFGFITSAVWSPTINKFGVGSLLLGSIAIATVALIIAFPISIATALMINEYAPKGLRPWLTAIIDALATVPSIIYGFWGLVVVSSLQIGPARWLAHNFGFIAFLRTPSPGYFGKSIFATGLVCALTIVPIVTSVSREVMAQAPRDVCEAALGLGGTRWGMVTEVIFPFSKNGIVGAALLGFGRGLGETMIPVLMLSTALKITPDILGPNGLGSISAEITREFVESNPLEESALILAGLVLFAATLVVTYVARLIVTRSGTGVK